MKIYSLKILNIFVLIGIALTLLAMAGTPLVLTASLKHYTEFMAENPHAVISLTISFYLCVLPFLMALIRLKKMCRHFTKKDFFLPEISEGFRRIAVYAFLDGIIIFAVQFAPTLLFGSFMYALTVIPAFVFPFVCVSIGLLSLVMSVIFREAAELKAENELIF